jgi:hypothetical protein
MPKDNSFLDHEMTLVPVEDKVGHLTPLQHFIVVCQATLECFAINREIIHKHLHDLLNQLENIAIMDLWNDAEALHNPNNICLYAKVPYEHVKMVLLW